MSDECAIIPGSQPCTCFDGIVTITTLKDDELMLRCNEGTVVITAVVHAKCQVTGFDTSGFPIL